MSRFYVLLSALSWLFAASASADGPYEGEWRRGPMTITVSIATWGADCGGRPESTTVPARGTVNVTQEGDHLTFGGGRSTRSCWSDNPAVRRVSNTTSSGTWRVVCRTPTEDSRQETGTYTLRATNPDTIEFRDVTEYDWTLNDSHCRATSTTTQTFTRVAGGSVAEPTPTPDVTPTPEPDREPSPACTPGAAARVALRPMSADVEPGGRVCFTARVVDANGCPLRGTSPTLVLRAPAGRNGTLRGTCFEAGATAAEGEGEFAIEASSGTMRSEARIRVHTLDLSDLIARRAESGDVVTDPGVARSDTAAGVAARSEAAPAALPWWVLAVAAVGLLIVIGTAATLMSRRRARARRHAELASAPEPFAAPANAAPAMAVPAPAPPASVAAVATAEPELNTGGQAKICPTCRRGYAASERTCARDGTELVLYATFVQKSEAVAQSICPKCGTRYTGTTRFCGKDGTTLEPVN